MVDPTAAEQNVSNRGLPDIPVPSLWGLGAEAESPKSAAIASMRSILAGAEVGVSATSLVVFRVLGDVERQIM